LREQINFGGPSPEQWLALRKAAESGSGVKRALQEADLPERTERLWIIVADADKIAAAAEADAEGAAERKRDNYNTLRYLRNAQPATVADARQIQAEVDKLQAEYDADYLRIEIARIARIHRASLRQIFPGYFGVTKRCPVRDQLPETVRAELARLKISEQKAEPWRDLNFEAPVQFRVPNSKPF